AIEARVAVGPDDDAAAVAAAAGVGADHAIAADVGALGILDAGVLALVVTADQHGAAARLARSIDDALADDADAHAERLDLAALAAAAGRFDRAADQGSAAFGLEHDLAAACAVGRDAAAGIQRQVLGGDEADLATGADDRAARLDHAAVAHQRAVHADAARIGHQR